jgi:Flp pilus assembly protein TadD
MGFAHIDSLMQKADWDQAIHEIQVVLQVQPANPILHAYLGMCFFRKADFEAAVDPLRKATILDPKFFEAGVKLAQALDKLKRYAEAYDVAHDFLAIHPGDQRLQYLVQALEPYANARRQDGWERTTHVGVKQIEHF